ncbi:MAG: phage tail protein [Vogesella sp.]|uniref:phage tail-collar fiber domain-containing protein n=1 Tax=Vogesella sp. TaxID=1904252 RepID=UPI003919BFC6
MYTSIHTLRGLSLMAQAELASRKIDLVEMAVGDGAGNPVTPNPEQNALVRERYRARINRVFPDPLVPNKYTAEMIVPADVGGFTLREIGVFDANGNLFVVGNLPETYKPTALEGAFGDAVYRVVFMVTNANVVNLVLDPNVVQVTRAWLMNNVTVATLLPGGLTNQVLMKDSNADGDVRWGSPEAIGISVNSIEEMQLLADGQTIVDWQRVNVNGLSVYIDGVRLNEEQWAPHPTVYTRIILARAYPAGTRIVGAQNEPAGRMPDALDVAANLSDVADKAAARANLGVMSLEEAWYLAPVTMTAFFDYDRPPPGWLVRDGAQVSRSVYSTLYGRIGTRYGVGDGFQTYNLPDSRGLFFRSLDAGRGFDPGRALGSLQYSQNLEHSHIGWTDQSGSHQHDTGWGEFTGGPFGNARGGAQGSGSTDYDNYSYLTASAGLHAHSFTTAQSGGKESRPVNQALLACIRYKGAPW